MEKKEKKVGALKGPPEADDRWQITYLGVQHLSLNCPPRGEGSYYFFPPFQGVRIIFERTPVRESAIPYATSLNFRRKAAEKNNLYSEWCKLMVNTPVIWHPMGHWKSNPPLLTFQAKPWRHLPIMQLKDIDIKKLNYRYSRLLLSSMLCW